MRSRERTEVLHIRLTPEEMRRAEQHAASHGWTVSEYARACLQQDWVMSGDERAKAEAMQDAMERLLGRFLGRIGPGKARQTPGRALPLVPEPRPAYLNQGSRRPQRRRP